MKKRWLAILGMILLAAALWGCGSNGGSGGSAVTDPTAEEPDAIGTNACQTCHAGAHTDASAVLRNIGPPDFIDTLVAPLAADETIYSVTHDCEACHGNGQFHANAPANVAVPVPEPTRETCATAACHGSQVEKFVSSRHANQSARAGYCSACHSHQGAVEYFEEIIGEDGQLTTNTELETLYNAATISIYQLPVGSDTIDGVTRKNCSTCHTPLTLALRGAEDDIATGLLPANGSTATVDTTRTVFSKEFNLCTACHMVDLTATFDDEAGYDERGMYLYQLSDAYTASNLLDNGSGTFDLTKAPFYHDGDSGNGRTLVDTHFGGDIMEHLVLFNGSTDIITIKGYNINPGSEDACTICHDPHTAGKMLSIDSSSTFDYADQLDNLAVGYAEGLGDFHTDYLGDAFSRINTSASCMPCHSGNAFLELIQGETISDNNWKVVGCRSCHELDQPNATANTNDSAAFAAVREFPAGYEFKFNATAAAPVPVADLGVNQVCFECHKGRTPGVDVAALPDPAAGTMNYTISYLHYAPSMAILFGDESKMVATYNTVLSGGRTYAGRFVHAGDGQEYGCVDCHDVHDTDGNHAYENKMITDSYCAGCHDAGDVTAFQARTQAFSERLLDEILADMLAIDTTVAPGSDLNATLKAKIVSLQDSTYPNADFASQDEELMAYIQERQAYFPNKTVAHAATTWKIFTYEDGAPHGQTHGHGGSWAHNSKFARQMMYDAIQSLGGSLTGLTRP